MTNGHEHNEPEYGIEHTVKCLRQSSPSAAKLLEKIYESAENELISLTNYIPELKSNETFQHMLTMAMVGQYMTGLGVGSLLPDELRDECVDELEIIGEFLGFEHEDE